jgi:hypothetical protein
MMKRFSRKRRGAEGRSASIEAAEWLPRILEQGLVEADALEPWNTERVPGNIAAIGRGQRTDGSAVLVAFSPFSATDAMLGGLAAAQQLVESESFAGELLIVAPQWPAGARRVLGMLGQVPYRVEPVAAPGLASGRVVVEPEPAPRILAATASQLASRMESSESRSSFSRAAAALEGLAAKHGGSVRLGLDRLELVVLARRVAEIRADGESAVLEVQIGGRTTTPLSGADLAGALDGLEGQLRRRLNDRKVREGEEGLRGRVVAQLGAGSELRHVRAWPQPGTDQDVIDAVGVDEKGQPVVVAVREAFDWRALSAVLESLGPVESLLPVLFSEASPPLRLGKPRLLLTATSFVDGLESALAALTLAFELRVVSGGAGAELGMVSRATGEGAELKPSGRRGRRRGGRGRSGGSEDAATDTNDEQEDEGRSDTDRSEAAADSADSRAGAEEEGGRRGGRRRRRSRRGGRGQDADHGEAEASARAGRESDDSGSGGESSRRRRRFEEVSLMDLDDGPEPGDSETASADDESGGDRRRRGRRRGRRNGGRDTQPDEDSESAEVASADDEDAVTEDDLVDADDLSEILARLPDDVPEFEARPAGYDDDDDDEDEDPRAARANRGRMRGGLDDAEDSSSLRKRSAILVHADPDSVLAAILLARDVRQLDGMWVYPQAELMTFFRSIATDLRDDTPIFVVGFTPSPAHDVIQAASLYRGRLSWFDRQVWAPEDLHMLREALGEDAIHGADGMDSVLPLLLETCSRRSRFSDKLVDLATGRFSQHDFERWGRLWRWRAEEIARKHGDIRGDIAALLAGRPSDLAKEAALVDVPPPPPEVVWVAERDFRMVHFGGHAMVVLEVEPGIDVHLASRVARERYDASLSLAHVMGEEVFVFAGDETTGKRALDYMAIAEHLCAKLEWVEARPDADHVSRFRIRGLDRHPERLEEVVGEIAMGRSLLER